MNNITDEGVNELCGALSDDKSHCEVIDLRSNAFGSLAAQKLGVALGTNIYVQELFLSHNDIGGEGAAALCASLAPTNAGFSAISVLDLRHCGIDDAGAERLGKSLVGNTALKTVGFWGNGGGDGGGGAIGAALQNERCMIKNMNLSNNMIGEVSRERSEPRASLVAEECEAANEATQQHHPISSCPATPSLVVTSSLRPPFIQYIK